MLSVGDQVCVEVSHAQFNGGGAVPASVKSS